MIESACGILKSVSPVASMEPYEAIAIHRFDKTNERHLALGPAQRVRVTYEDGTGWCYGTLPDGSAGYFPKSYVQRPPPPPAVPPPSTSSQHPVAHTHVQGAEVVHSHIPLHDVYRRARVQLRPSRMLHPESKKCTPRAQVWSHIARCGQFDDNIYRRGRIQLRPSRMIQPESKKPPRAVHYPSRRWFLRHCNHHHHT